MRVKKLLSALIGATVLAAVATAGPANAEDDPALDQTVTESEQVAPRGETTVFTDGHIDLGR
ncbi:MAG: hypothetical protein Q4P06_02495 [Actinomycetaceae bacterium]|nr:hypothetical protein [Actinomycetaceae bacterium]